MTDPRPSLAVAHVTLTVSDVARSHDFYRDLGLREVWRGPEMAILELRGGTHLLLFKGAPSPGDAPFDLMVDDVEAFRAALQARGVEVSDVGHDERSGHAHIDMTDPDGYVLWVCSSHADGRPV
jgi:catechol 2,3-dioxygenase-like lactoylglutathione lyase family enzyme